MCHGSNTLWNLAEVDERLVEKPVAPGGATGGVEFEAMGYVVSGPCPTWFMSLMTPGESFSPAEHVMCASGARGSGKGDGSARRAPHLGHGQNTRRGCSQGLDFKLCLIDFAADDEESVDHLLSDSASRASEIRLSS